MVSSEQNVTKIFTIGSTFGYHIGMVVIFDGLIFNIVISSFNLKGGSVLHFLSSDFPDFGIALMSFTCL